MSDDFDELEVKQVHPFQALKRYRCPGCDQWIEPGVGHTVVIPTRYPEDRRHWHTVCWQHRDSRRPN